MCVYTWNKVEDYKVDLSKGNPDYSMFNMELYEVYLYEGIEEIEGLIFLYSNYL